MGGGSWSPCRGREGLRGPSLSVGFVGPGHCGCHYGQLMSGCLAVLSRCRLDSGDTRLCGLLSPLCQLLSPSEIEMEHSEDWQKSCYNVEGTRPDVQIRFNFQNSKIPNVNGDGLHALYCGWLEAMKRWNMFADQLCMSKRAAKMPNPSSVIQLEIYTFQFYCSKVGPELHCTSQGPAHRRQSTFPNSHV